MVDCPDKPGNDAFLVAERTSPTHFFLRHAPGRAKARGKTRAEARIRVTPGHLSQSHDQTVEWLSFIKLERPLIYLLVI